MNFDPSILEPGDVLLYRYSSFVGFLIAIKTFDVHSHAEVYVGNGTSLAARVEGVDYYPTRVDKDLVCVRRAEVPLRIEDGKRAIVPFLKKPYSIKGLFTFFDPWRVHSHVHRICSVMVYKFLLGCGAELFNPSVDDNKIAPAQLYQTGLLRTIWEREDA